MTRILAAAPITFLALLLSGGLCHAGIVSEGAQVRGASGTDWSSDLGLDYRYPISLDDPGDFTSPIGTGSTTMSHPFGYYLSGESVYNESYFSSLGYLGSFQRIDIAAAGDLEGKVHNVHMESTVPPVGVYGLGAHSAVNTNFYFSGGIPGPPTTAYYAFDWLIQTTIVGAGPSMEYGVYIGGIWAAGGGEVRNLSGTVSGAFNLGNCSGGTSFNGAGCNTSLFSFATFNPAGSSNPGGTSSLDVAFVFSSTPITAVPTPLPASYPMLVAGLALLGYRRRRRAAEAH